MTQRRNIILADDDSDDCELFEDALREVSLESLLTTAKDGLQLMKVLNETVPPPPDVIFLDLNMPRKNGFECLKEIRSTPKLKTIPIVIFSTSSEPTAMNEVYIQGADYYVCKPGDFQLLKKAIKQVLAIDWVDHTRPTKDNFLLQI